MFRHLGSGPYSFPSCAEGTFTLVSLKRKVRECDLRKEPKVCGPNSSDPLSLGASVSLCGSASIMWVNRVEGRFYEILGSCPI